MTEHEQQKPAWRKDFVNKFVKGSPPQWAGAEYLDGDSWIEADEEQVMDWFADKLTQAHKEWKAEVRRQIEKDDLINEQEHWLTKSLETVEYGMAMDALRDYRRDILDLPSLQDTEESKL